MNSFIQSADSRETSIELLKAILEVAANNEEKADYIWTEGPTEKQRAEIIAIVTKNGEHETTDFCWGAAGFNWANEQPRQA